MSKTYVEHHIFDCSGINVYSSTSNGLIEVIFMIFEKITKLRLD